MTPFFDNPGSRWFHIPAHRSFVQDLAQGLMDALSPLGPEALADAVVLVPTRRGARALADAFVQVCDGRALLPPQIRPLGDLEAGEPPFEPGDLALDLPAAIDPIRRRFELTALVAELSQDRPGGSVNAGAALDLADALGRFLDGLQIEEVRIEGRLEGLVDAELAEHWQVSRSFLERALALWPARLAELGVVDISERRVRLLRQLAERWNDQPPGGVLVAAGSTGTAPATRALLMAVARAPRGAVVLPGLDQNLAATAWATIDAQHPQGALKRLLDEAKIAKGEVQLWPASVDADMAGRWRQRVINEALRPPEATADWLTVIETLREGGKASARDPIAEGLAGLSLVTARHEDEAATVVALLLRETLQTLDRTAALVTPDAALARRVVTTLGRWGVVPDSSVGVSLAGSSCGTLAGLLARAASDPLNPVTLLGLLKHPLTAMGDATGLEQAGLRGPRARSWADLTQRLDKDPAAQALANRLQAILEPLAFSADAEAPASAARRLTIAMEALAAGDDGRLWAGPDGEATAHLLSALIHDSSAMPEVTAQGFALLLTRLMDGETLRAGGATHPRLRILGAIEARMVRADRLVVAGLEEGVWPGAAQIDPFLSRPMRTALGLPSPERRIGLAAHDFAQAACAPEVILLHTERREGAPSVKSRWLWRLQTLARGADLSLPGHPQVLEWARMLDAAGAPEATQRPAPRPPLAARPRSLAVTRIETLTRDPYAVWARDILRLYPLRRPDETPDARERGTAIHRAFEQFATAFPRELPADAALVFEALYVDALRRAGVAPDALARETALAREAAIWVAEVERDRRADGRAIHVELRGEMTFPAPGGPFTLSARADRIETTADGLGHILDYKTGKAPSKKEVMTGFSPQLTLTAAILATGGFPTLGALTPGDLTYLEVTGRRPAGRIETRAVAHENSELLTALALDGVKRLVAAFDNPNRPYASRTAPQFVKARGSDYDHLARVFEWSTSGEADDA